MVWEPSEPPWAAQDLPQPFLGLQTAGKCLIRVLLRLLPGDMLLLKLTPDALSLIFSPAERLDPGGPLVGQLGCERSGSSPAPPQASAPLARVPRSLSQFLPCRVQYVRAAGINVVNPRRGFRCVTV
jgi:hypothetical protein